LVFPPTGVAAGVLRHFEQDEVAEAALIEPPGGGKPRDAAPNNDDRNFDAAFRWGEVCAIAKLVTWAVAIIDEAAGNGTIGLGREADKRGAQELAAAAAQCVISRQSCS
jgi:hypothetical protein